MPCNVLLLNSFKNLRTIPSIRFDSWVIISTPSCGLGGEHRVLLSVWNECSENVLLSDLLHGARVRLSHLLP